jgi:hypothetical protein
MSTTFHSTPVNPEPFYQGSVKDGDHRTLGESAKAAFAASESPFDDMIGANYAKSVEKIKDKTIVPPKVRRPAMMYTLYHVILRERIPVNYKRLEEASPDPTAARLCVIPFMFRCPHPTKAEVDSWTEKWPILRAECEALAPGYKFEPYIIHGNKPTDSVMMAVIMHR